MMLKFQWFVLVLFVSSTNLFAQFYEVIENDAVNYFLSLADDNSKSDLEFEKLKTALYSDIEVNELENTYQTTTKELDSLKKHFNEYESSIKNISSDSVIVLFNQWYLHFSNIFYNYTDEKFFSSNKNKILFFSASMSCQCTLDMCRKQTVEILNLAKELDLNYWIVDSYEHNELQIKYETLFAPAVVVLDKSGNVLSKIEYDEKMINLLSDYFQIKPNKNNLE